MSGVKLATIGVGAEQFGNIMTQYQFGRANREAMLVLAKTTYQPLSQMAQQIGRATLEYMQRDNFKDTQTVLKALNKFVDSEFLRKTGIEGVADVVVGSSSWQTAAREIRDKILKDGGLKVPYYNKKGDVVRFVDAKDYAKMVSRTTTANVMREGAKDRIKELFDGQFDLVEILGHSAFPNSPCIPYEGQILSLEGITKGYTTIAEAKANGLFHPNCIHSFGVSEQVLEIYDKMDEAGELQAKEEEKDEAPPEQTSASGEEKAQEDHSEYTPKALSIKQRQNALIKRAKEEADRFVEGDGKSTFDNNITLENLNTFNIQMSYLTQKYGVKDFKTVGTYTFNGEKKPLAHANNKIIQIETLFGAAKNSDFEIYYKKNVQDFKFGNFNRNTTQLSPQTYFRDTVTHEFGHVLMGRKIVQEIKKSGKNLIGKYKLSETTTSTYKLIEDTYKKAIQTGDIYKISFYASTEPKEFFAECFSLYEIGIEFNKLPVYIKNMVIEVIK